MSSHHEAHLRVLGSGGVSVEQEWSTDALFSFTCWTCLSFKQRIGAKISMKPTVLKPVI